MGDDWDWGAYANNTVTTPASTDSFVNNNGIFFCFSMQRPRSSAAITDGLSNTLAIGEKVFNEKFANSSETFTWMNSVGVIGTAASPLNGTDEKTSTSASWDIRWGFSSLHPGGAQFLMGDGSVRFVSETVALPIYRAMATMNGGEVASN
jgi:prepilin-type processing-associated H-X9-DG protein